MWLVFLFCLLKPLSWLLKVLFLNVWQLSGMLRKEILLCVTMLTYQLQLQLRRYTCLLDFLITSTVYPSSSWHVLQGLMTPIIRNADQKSISAISLEVILFSLKFNQYGRLYRLTCLISSYHISCAAY